MQRSIKPAESAAEIDRFEADELLDIVADCLETFDKTDLFNIAEPILAITGDAVPNAMQYTESQLRHMLVEQCKHAYETNIAGLSLIQKVLFSFMRQKMRRE